MTDMLTTELRTEAFAAFGTFSRDAMRAVTCSLPFSDKVKKLGVQLTTYVLTEHLEDKQAYVTFKMPSSWWQHWKQDCAPAWFTRRWPVRFTTIIEIVKYEQVAMYPKANLSVPELGPATIKVLRA